MIGIIIQARLGSTRLPKKMVKPFYVDTGIFELITNKILNNFPEIKVVVATTTNPIDDELENICKKFKINYYRGSENNVLQRFIEAAEQNNISKIVRVCADNPFLNIEVLKELVDFGTNSNVDYLSYQTSRKKPTILTHYGFWAEVVAIDALKKVKQLTSEKLYLEHVTNFVYQHPEIFAIELITIPKEIERLPKVRMTLDTEEDFLLLQEIYQSIPDFQGTPLELVSIVAKNKNWLKRMETQILKNEK